MTRDRQSHGELGSALFTPEERWGWEYVEPDPPRPFHQDPPEWEEPLRG